jgi:hypothetical protein
MATSKHTTPAVQLDLPCIVTEEWRPVVGWEGFYEVSNLGQVRSLDRWVRSKSNSLRFRKGIILRQKDPGRHKKRKQLPYLLIHLRALPRSEHRSVHSLVIKAFVGPRPPGMVCNHMDGNPQNNHATNLEWVTPSENLQHAVRLGKQMGRRGEKHHATSLTETDIYHIRLLLRAGSMQQDLALMFGVSDGTISNIAHKKTWGHLPDMG